MCSYNFKKYVKYILYLKYTVYIPSIPSRTFCVTVNVFPVSRGTVQLTGSGDRIIICSGDLTRVGSGGDLTMCSMISCVGNGLALDTEPTSLSVSSSSKERGARCGVKQIKQPTLIAGLYSMFLKCLQNKPKSRCFLGICEILIKLDDVHNTLLITQ